MSAASHTRGEESRTVTTSLDLSGDRGSVSWGIVVAVMLVALVGGVALGHVTSRSQASHDRVGLPLDETQHYAVFLVNGQVFFGRPIASMQWEPVSQSVLRMRDVYYVQTQVDPETRETRNILVRRGNEWHRPSEMAVHPDQVITIEPVGADSTVSDLIRQLREQNP
jgi:hypothetical protein